MAHGDAGHFVGHGLPPIDRRHAGQVDVRRQAVLPSCATEKYVEAVKQLSLN
jgi:hypothetical protein